MFAALADISILQLLVIAATAMFTSVVGGVAGYGTGALLPLVLVPIIGSEPVVPVIALQALSTNVSRIIAFRDHVSWRKAAIVILCAAPTCALGAWGYTLLTGKGASIIIGTMMMLSIPLRRMLKRRGFECGERGLGVAAVGWGVIVGGTTGSGIILLSILMAAGLHGPAVIATDAAISIGIAAVKISTFGMAGVITPQVLAVAAMIAIVVFPGAFLAKRLVDAMPIHLHTAMLDAVVIVGGALLVIGALVRG